MPDVTRAFPITRACTVLALAALVAAPSARAEGVRLATAPAVVSAPALGDCAGGTIYDDGTFEDFGRITDGAGNGVTGALVMEFDFGSTPRRLDDVCVCWNRTDVSAAPDLSYQLVFFDDDGAGGSPGGPLGPPLDVTDHGIPVGAPTFYSHDISGRGLEVSGHVYLGVLWNGGDDPGPGHQLCLDTTANGPQRVYLGVTGSPWTLVDEQALGAPLRAIGVRAEASEQVVSCPQTPCVEDDTTICLNDGRFRVTATFDPVNDGDTIFDPAHAERITDDTGYLWFFNAANVEAVVKVLDACVPPYDRFWVFAGGLTNVETRIAVCDTEAGIQRNYHNPQQTPFEPVQDTQAFATCP